MRKISLVFGIVLLVVILAACQPAPQAAVSPEPSQVQATDLPAVTETPVESEATTATVVPTTEFTASAAATCQPSPVVPTPDPAVASAIDGDTSASRTLGPATARITLDVFSDFQCPYCANFAPVIHELVKAYPDEIKIVYHYLPLSEIHDKAKLAAQGAEAAAIQGKFWEMHDAIFSNQDKWTAMTEEEFTTWLVNEAKQLNLNSTQFKTDLTSEKVIQTVDAGRTTAETLNLNSTPSVVVNRLLRSSRNDMLTLSGYLDFVKLADRSTEECPPMTIDPSKQYTATIKTEKGDIVIRLFPDKAPWAVNSFVYLAESGWYKDSGFFRVITDFMAQTGDPSNTGLGSPGYQYGNEVTPELRFDRAGLVGMANAGADTNGAQFFITYAPLPNLDGSYTIFGEVISGMDVLKTIRPRNPASDAILFEPDPILSITIEEK